MYIIYKLDAWSNNFDTAFTRVNCLFEAVKLTKNFDPDKHQYSGYVIGYDSRSYFSWTDGSKGENFIVFAIDNSSFVHFDGRNINILVLRPTEDLDNTTITAEAKYPINFTETGTRLITDTIYCCLIKYLAKQKHLLPFFITNNKPKEFYVTI